MHHLEDSSFPSSCQGQSNQKPKFICLREKVAVPGSFDRCEYKEENRDFAIGTFLLRMFTLVEFLDAPWIHFFICLLTLSCIQ